MSAQSNFGGGSAEKGKGKAAEIEDVSMGEGDSSEEESADDVEADHDEEDAEVDDDDNLDEIDPANIIVEGGGRRTRGKVIDFAKAAENTPADEEDEDEDDDYEAPNAAGDEDMMEH